MHATGELVVKLNNERGQADRGTSELKEKQNKTNQI